jgi:hypothetical protein
MQRHLNATAPILAPARLSRGVASPLDDGHTHCGATHAALPKLSTRPQPSPRNIHMYKPLDALATKPLLRRALSAEVQQGKTQALTPGGSVAPCCTTLRGRQAS